MTATAEPLPADDGHPADVDQVRHFAHHCPGRLERAGLDAVCSRCCERFLDAYDRLARKVIPAGGITPDERAELNSLAQHIARERLEREQPLIPREYSGGSA